MIALASSGLTVTAPAISTGRLGLPMALGLVLGPITLHEQTVELYRTAAEQAGNDAVRLPVSITAHGYVGRTSQSARDTMYPYFAQGSGIAASAGESPGRLVETGS